jgi:hypothetical protein
MRVDEAYGAAGITPAVTDAQFRLTCDACETEQTLDEMPLSSVADVTIYACKECGQSLVGVKPFKEDAEAREHSGYRLTDNVVGNKVDLILDLRPGAPASCVQRPRRSLNSPNRSP